MEVGDVNTEKRLINQLIHITRLQSQLIAAHISTPHNEATKNLLKEFQKDLHLNIINKLHQNLIYDNSQIALRHKTDHQ